MGWSGQRQEFKNVHSISLANRDDWRSFATEAGPRKKDGNEMFVFPPWEKLAAAFFHSVGRVIMIRKGSMSFI
jgi:hypothetical protein